MIKNFFLYAVIMLTVGCKGLKTINGSYINKKNGHKIKLLDSGKFVYQSYDGFDGKYYSYGKWKSQNQTIILESDIPKPYVEVHSTKNQKSAVILKDYRDNPKNDSLEILINSKLYDESNFNSNELLYSLKVIRKNDGSLLKEVNLEKARYEIEINIADTQNEISMENMTLKIKNRCLIDEFGNKFKKKKN